MNRRERLVVDTWIDGDSFHGTYTATVTVTLPWRERTPIELSMSTPVHVRVWGYNAYELRGENAALGKAALEYVRALCPEGSVVEFESRSGGKEKFGRWLARIKSPAGGWLDEQMVAYSKR